jgi:hypothetical protein
MGLDTMMLKAAPCAKDVSPLDQEKSDTNLSLDKHYSYGIVEIQESDKRRYHGK